MFRRPRRMDDFSAEIQSHIEMETDRLQAEGMDISAARARAIREFGNRGSSEERFFESSPFSIAEGVTRDLRYASRVLRNSPAFTLVAVLSLALGIGANTAIFQLVDAIRLRMLPVKNPDQLVQVRLTDMSKVRGFRNGENTLTYPIWNEIRERQQALSEVFAWSPSTYDLATAGEPRLVQGMVVSGGFFSALGLQPKLGRLLQEADDAPGCGFPGAVISYAFWQREYGGLPGAIGSKLNLNRHPVEIIGVTSPGFFGMEVGRSFDVAVPVCTQGALLGMDLQKLGTNWWMTVMGRLKPGWDVSRASAYFKALSPSVFPTSLPPNYPPVSVEDYLALRLAADPAGQGVSSLREEYSEPLFLLLAIAGMVLLIACANLANLMLARASARKREIAVRLAIGASRGRLVRQLMVETLLISAVGASLGLVAAQVLSVLLISLLNTQGNMVFVNLDRDWRVFAFAGALAVLTAVLFGLAPALRTTRTGPGDVLKSAGRGTTAGREGLRLRRLLVVVQVALSLVLVVGALLFSSTLTNLLSAETGFRQQGVLIARVAFGTLHLPKERISGFRQELLERLRAIPGVAAAGDTDTVPLSGNSISNAVWMDGQLQSHARECMRSRIGPGYFDALQIPLLAGRSIEVRDNDASPRVAVVNEAFARELMGGANPVGKRLWVEATPSESAGAYEIVGMVQNTKYGDLREKFPPIVYQAQSQDLAPTPGDSFLIRSPLPMNTLTPEVRSALTGASPGIRYQFQVFEASIRDTLVQEKLMASLSSAFGILAGLLATVGLYGVMAYLVTQRRTEIGIRIAMGAGRREIVGMVLRESVILLGYGLVAGAVLSRFATASVAKLLFGLKATDLRSLLGAAGLLVLVALAASYVPARRAANVDPNTALRQE